MLFRSVLDPSTARTVREIVANPPVVKPHFLFRPTDSTMIASFVARMQALIAVRRQRQALLLMLVVLGVGFFFLYPVLVESPERSQERDLARMYQSTMRAPYQATAAAVASAYRALKRVASSDVLCGKTREEAEALLGIQSLGAGYRDVIRDESDLPTRSAEDIFDSRTRFLTITDGQRRVILYVRFDASGEKISLAEVEEEGWDPQVDAERRAIGAGWRRSAL